MVADEQLEDRLLLRRVQLEPELGGVGVEPVEHGIGVVRHRPSVAGRCRISGGTGLIDDTVRGYADLSSRFQPSPLTVVDTPARRL